MLGCWILFSWDVVLAEQVCQLHGDLREVFGPLGESKKKKKKPGNGLMLLMLVLSTILLPEELQEPFAGLQQSLQLLPELASSHK